MTALKQDDGTFDVVGFVMEYEDGTLTEDEMIDGFQYLVDTGLAWSLQGHYGRTAVALIEAGYVKAPARGAGVRDAR